LCLVLQALSYTQIKIPVVLNLGGILILSNDKEHFCIYLKILVIKIILILKFERRKTLCMLELNKADYQADQGLESYRTRHDVAINSLQDLKLC